MRESTKPARTFFPVTAAFSVVILTFYMNLRVAATGWYGFLLSFAGMACLYIVGSQLFRNRWAGLFSAYVFMLAMLYLAKFGIGDVYIVSLVPFACLSLGQGIMVGFRALSRLGTLPLMLGMLVFMVGNAILLLRIG